MSSENSPAVQEVPFEKIRTDGGTQVRVELDVSHVNDLAEAIADGKELPPLKVFFDGSDYWLVDGFHRLAAWRRTEAKVLSCRVEFGDRRAAVLRACGVNSDHGLKRSNADKRNAVMTLLKDEEWAGCSDRWIASACSVGRRLVASCRDEVQVAQAPPDQKTRREKSDAPSKGDTSKVGGDSPQAPARSASRVGQDGKVYPAKAIEQKSGAPSGVPVSVGSPVESPVAEVPVAAAAGFDLAAEVEGVRRYLSALLARCPDAKRSDVLDAIKAVVAENSNSEDLVLESDGKLVLMAKAKAARNGTGTGSLMDAWNRTEGVARCLSWNKKRETALRARLKEKWWADNWRTAIGRVGPATTPFLCGRNDRGWVASVDWFLRPGSVAAILEGQYDLRNGSREGSTAELLDEIFDGKVQPF